jgi:hypothetical protein
MTNSPEVFLMVFLASLCAVFLKTFQQISVANKRYWWIVPVSIMMCVLEVFMVGMFVKNGLSTIILVAGIGSGIGSCIAIWVNTHLTDDNLKGN